MDWGLLFGAMILAGIVCDVGGISKTMDRVWCYILKMFFFCFSLEGVMWSCEMGFDSGLGGCFLCWVFLGGGGKCGWSSGFEFGLAVGGV